MARKKSDQGPALPLETDDRNTAGIFDRINGHKEDAKEINAKAASLRKGLKELGIDTRAANVGCSLRNLEEGSDRDTATRGILMAIRAANPAARKIAVAVFGLTPEILALEIEAFLAQTIPVPDKSEAQEEADSESDDDAEAQAMEDEAAPSEYEDGIGVMPSDDMDTAGHSFNDGRSACISGYSVDDNPYDPQSTDGRMWAKGYQSAVNVAADGVGRKNADVPLLSAPKLLLAPASAE